MDDFLSTGRGESGAFFRGQYTVNDLPTSDGSAMPDRSWLLSQLEPQPGNSSHGLWSTHEKLRAPGASLHSPAPCKAWRSFPEASQTSRIAVSKSLQLRVLARMVNCKRRSEGAIAPASVRTSRNLPGLAKRNASGASGAGGGESTYRSMTRDSVQWKGFLSAKCQTAKASFRPGLSTLNISRTASTGEGKNITPKRLITASKASAGNGRWSAKATSNCAFFNPKRSVARRAAATIAGTGSILKTLPSGPTQAATLNAGSPAPVAISRTACCLPI